jgi:signal transduction histidine kinase
VLASVFDTLPGHIAVLDGEGTIVAVNAAWRRFWADNGGTDPRACVGTDYLAVCVRAGAAVPGAAAVEAGLRRVLAGSGPFELEYPCDGPGTRRRFQMHAARWAGRGPVRVVVSHADVTDRWLAEQSLREADRRKDEFLAMLAHELRNPLAPMRNAVRFVARSEVLTPSGRASVEMIGRQLEQLTQLVDDLLDVSRITRGKVELRLRPIDVRDAVRRAVDAIGSEAAARGHAVSVALPPHPVRVDADPVRLAQMLGNLLGNACKYTPDGGRIDVVVTADEGAVEVRVTDTGMGIEPDQIARLFELFQQGDAAPGRAPGGLGVGLTVVRELAELHGGRVSASSPGPGRGASFAVALPRREPPGEG